MFLTHWALDMWGCIGLGVGGHLLASLAFPVSVEILSTIRFALTKRAMQKGK